MDDIDWSKWDKASNEARNIKDIPQGAVTARMLAERWGLRGSRTREILREMVDSGKAERYGSGNSFFYVLK